MTLEHRHHLEYRADVGNDLIEHEVVDVYVAEATDDMPLEPNPDEVMAVEWIRYEDLLCMIDGTPEKFTPWVRIYLQEHAQTIFGDVSVLA